MGWLLLTFALSCIIWRVVVAARVWHDARQRGSTALNGLRWALTSLVNAHAYWWNARLEVMSASEAQVLLLHAAQAHDLTHVTDMRCPLCDHKIANALAVSEAGTLIATRRGTTCDRCDFRLDACRHCRHFLPATPAYVGPTISDVGSGDFTHGRCSRYRELQPVRDTHPHMARRLEAMGYEYLPAPKRIRDSYFPLDECTAFSLDPKRLRRSEIPWLTRQRLALIHLHQRLHGGTRR